MARYALEALVDLEQIRQLMESHHLSSGMACALLDPNEEKLIAVGWQDICTRFHRVNPVTAARCRESDACIKAHLADPGGRMLEYRCGNGMIDVAMPILVDGELLGTMFVGQFFREEDPPDRPFFVNQARVLGFDEAAYLQALDRVPTFSSAYIHSQVLVLQRIVTLLAEIGLKNLQLRREMEERRQAEEKQQRLNRELRAISDCNQVLMRAEDEHLLLDAICRIICEEAGYHLAWVGYVEHDPDKTIRVVARAGCGEGYLLAERLTWADTDQGKGPAGCAVRTGRPVCFQDLDANAGPGPWRSNARDRGDRSTLALPLGAEGAEPFGVLGIYSTESGAFTQEEMRLLEELAGDLAFGVTVLRAREVRKRGEAVMRARLRLLEFASSHSLEELLTASLDEIEALTGSTIGFYHFVEPDQRTLHLQTWSTNTLKNMCSAEGKGSHYPIDQAGVWVDCVHLGGPVIHNDYPNLPHRKGLPEGHAPVLREAVAPILRGGLIKAIIGIGNKPTEYQETDLEILSQLGDLSWDIAERMRVEAAVAVREEEYRCLAEHSPDNIVRYDRACRTLYANTRFKTTMSVSEAAIQGRTPLELAAQEGHGRPGEIERYQAVLSRVIASGEAADVELSVPDDTGELRTHSVRFAPERDAEGRIVGALAFGRDITEQQKLAEQLRQSQKMEAIGKLAGGVAHDFNNLLTAIIGFSNLAKRNLGAGTPSDGYLDQILAASDRAANLTRALLAFSRKQLLLPRPVDLNGVVRNVESLLRRLIGEDIDLVIHLADVPLTAMADPGQIEQVLMNLATNARDAMPDGGRLAIATERKDLGKGVIGAQGFGAAGRYGLITVSDSGTGMDEATRAKIFEPFFTTKEKGKGTGLGLAIAYGIVKQHEGAINVYSEPGKGTSFRIYLPLLAEPVEDLDPEREAAEPQGGTETLLLVEDDPDVRALAGTVLREAGYRVLEAVDGQEALERFQAQAKEIDLLIMDVIMPRMGGREAHDRIRGLDPGVKVLFISGYTADALDSKGFFGNDTRFLAKPMSPVELLHKVRAILDGTG